MIPMPLEALWVFGDFAIQLPPGWYLLTATEVRGLGCGEVTVEVKRAAITTVEFTCQHR